MVRQATQPVKNKSAYTMTVVLTLLQVFGFALIAVRPARALPLSSVKVRPLPAFARK